MDERLYANRKCQQESSELVSKHFYTHENLFFDKYKVMSMTFDHPGVYTCRATYNGMTKYLSHYKKCVRRKFVKLESYLIKFLNSILKLDRDQYSEPTIHCHDVVKEVIVGSSFNLTLNSQLGFGGVDRVSLLWFKLHDVSLNLQLLTTKREFVGD